MKDARFYYSVPTVTITAEVVDCLNNNDYSNSDVIRFIPSTKQKMPRVTICSILDKNENTLSFGVAVCSKKDIFKKVEGRKLSFKRAIQAPVRIVTVDKSNISYIRKRVCEELEWDALHMNPKVFSK